MPVMTIIGCRMFEDEIMHLLENDPEIEKVLVVENEDCSGIMRKMAEAGITHTALPLEEIPEKSAGKDKGLTLIVYMLELALHAIPENLKKTVYSKVELMAPRSDGVLLFTGFAGMCSGKLKKTSKPWTAK